MRQKSLCFWKRLARRCQADLAIRIILDNYATHKHRHIEKWLDNPSLLAALWHVSQPRA